MNVYKEKKKVDPLNCRDILIHIKTSLTLK